MLPHTFAALADPGTQPHDLCLLVPPNLWAMFREVSLWVEALCLHEWCRCSEQVTIAYIDQIATLRNLTQF